LAGQTSDEDSALVDKLEKLYDIFAFYHGSLHLVYEQMEGDDKCFTDRLSFIWSHYYQTKEDKQASSAKVMNPVFHPLPYQDLPKTGCHFFLKASQILQSCQRQKGVLAGCILYNKSVLYTQLPPAFTEKLLVCATRSSSQKNDFTIKAGFRLPNFIRLYAIYLSTAEYEVLKQCQPESTRELLSELIPPLETSLMQGPVVTTPTSGEGRDQTKSSSSASTASPSSPSLLSRFGSRRLSLTKQQPHADSSPKTKQRLPLDPPLSQNLKNKVTVNVTMHWIPDGDCQADANKEQQRDGCTSQCEMVKEVTPGIMSVPCSDCQNKVETHCNERGCVDGQKQSGCVSCNPSSLVSNFIDGRTQSDCATSDSPLLVSNHIDGKEQSDECLTCSSHSLASNHVDGHAKFAPVSSPPSLASNKVTMKDNGPTVPPKFNRSQSSPSSLNSNELVTTTDSETSIPPKFHRAESCPPTLSSHKHVILNGPTNTSDEQRLVEGCLLQPTSASNIDVFPAHPVPIVSSDKTVKSSHQQLSLSTPLGSSTPDNSLLSPSLQIPYPSFDPALLSACSSYESLMEAEQPTQAQNPSRAQSPGSGDSVYLDCCHPGDESLSPSPQLPPNHALLPKGISDKEIPLLHETGTDSKQTEKNGLGGREDMAAPEQTDNRADRHTDDDSTNESATAESAPQIRQAALHWQESVLSGSSLTLSSLSDLASDFPDFGDEEKADEYKVDGKTCATLYIQAPEHSNLMLLLVADSQLEKQEEVVRFLWEGSLQNMADLTINLKECVSHLPAKKPVSSFYYASYNGYEKTLNTNCFHTSSRNARSFVQVTKALQKQHNSNSDVTDVVLRYPATCSAYARFSLGKEIYFEPRVAQPARLVAPPGSLESRDVSATDDTVGFNIEVTARTKLSDEAAINLV
jgi:hypothetical protein